MRNAEGINIEASTNKLSMNYRIFYTNLRGFHLKLFVKQMLQSLSLGIF